MEILEKISIKQWSEDDRPREKLLLKGTSALSDAELLAILIGSGSTSESAVELSRRILSEAASNNINKLARLSIGDLMKFKGIGEAKAISIVAALELSRRRLPDNESQKVRLNSSKDAYNYINGSLIDLPYEEFWILHLNRANYFTQKTLIGRGGISGTVADIRLMFKSAIENLSSAIIICHNHPSGNLQASSEDIRLTQKCVETGKIMDIPVLDHIIVAGNSYFSFADNGMIS